MGDGAMKEDYMIDGLVMESAILEQLKAWKVWKETGEYYAKENFLPPFTYSPDSNLPLSGLFLSLLPFPSLLDNLIWPSLDRT
jgi:hypothetical protein